MLESISWHICVWHLRQNICGMNSGEYMHLNVLLDIMKLCYTLFNIGKTIL